MNIKELLEKKKSLLLELDKAIENEREGILEGYSVDSCYEALDEINALIEKKQKKGGY